MFSRENLLKINDYLWEIPKNFRGDMRVPARIFAAEKMLDEIFRDRSLEQLANVATLPGIQKYAVVMPDAHEGYGFPIGGVAAFALKEGIISPGGIGYDINCGVRLLKSDVSCGGLKNFLDSLGTAIFREVPSGVGRRGRLKLSDRELNEVFLKGARRMIELGYGLEDDAGRLETGGKIENSSPEKVSPTARARGRDQLGTMGAGNHFVEVQEVEEIFNEEACRAFGLKRGQATVMIHTGSRGLGHQVATDFIGIMARAMPKYGIVIPDRELACAPFLSPEGQDYFGAMAAAANFAWANRQLITWEVRKAWREVLGKSGGELSVVYDVAHNIAKLEEYGGVKMVVHRKGATRSFGPGHPEINETYRGVGQPVLIPGSMGTASYVLVGTKKAAEEAFGSSCHGAGRRMSRHAARKKISGAALRLELEKRGIIIRAGSMSGLAEEAPFAYKEVDEVVEAVCGAGIARKAAKLKPLAVIKG